ncbi:putative nucleotidyltransferase with HDIG domain [Inhella inkyongensis]|uniref:Putative nucleotidyltransferase with HDIG domain n=1 Tax=Inhella inkyongensis TaxID=392593 RepID=A0A840S994_9BURK|nr:HD-GYP domain-containing protein [Inhella inkyongensis]MBB5206213.1 putative nucleotidyltransferase with HDIG domain [Inhella inkyongensis]
MASEELIDISQLKIGMFIHLDLGWMRHPFPLSSFRIGSEDQLQVLRKLGLKQVRWSPEKSQLIDEAPQPATSHTAGGAGGAAAASDTQTPEQLAAAARRAALLAEQQSLAQCEAQYAEAAKALGEVVAQVFANPQSAGQQAQQLTRSVVDKMLVAGDINLRLLTEAAGDRATAHALNVSLISLLLGRSCGLGEQELMALGTGALLHDIGKLEVESRFRLRSEQFNQIELSAYQAHVAKGVKLVQGMQVGPDALAVVAQHHEHADGSGFPMRLSGERMHALARIVALVNRFDGLCNPPVASKSLTPHEALSLMFAQGRSRFDATLLNAFIRMMGVYPPGSLVQLTDERYALVVAVNSSRPLKPRVLVHDSQVAAEDALTISLEDHPTLGIRRSLKAADLPRAATLYLRPRARFAYFFQASEPAGLGAPEC